MSNSRSSSPWVAYAAAVWALVFAVFHIIWACGWYVGLDQEFARTAFSKPLFLAWDVAVAGLCLLAVFVELALVRPWGRRVPRYFIVFCAWSGTGLLIAGVAINVSKMIPLVAKGGFTFGTLGIINAWFYLGAILFGVSTWRFCRPRRVSNAV
jgi:hypothetical protein